MYSHQRRTTQTMKTKRNFQLFSFHGVVRIVAHHWVKYLAQGPRVIAPREINNSEYITLGHLASTLLPRRKETEQLCDRRRSGNSWKKGLNSTNITVTSQWARRCLKSPASPLFTQPFIQAQIKENIKAPRHWPLCWEFTGEFPAQMASNAENVSIWWRHHELVRWWRQGSRHQKLT